ncbi:MAG: NAD(P)-dependent dehydrogenase (short-subunit alcohol dehydrogenase family) [Candidatus Poriferisodalaceae bacterium]|jgi:NAD(P)-dependent dehydrogenase (short-subunit alcohol dehydrogenase family)
MQRAASQEDQEMLDTTGRVVMITGANRGIGLALAETLHGEGWTVSLGGRDVAALTAATEELGSDRVSRHRYDTEDRTTEGAWVEATLSAHGRIDVLINNAGIADTASLVELDDAALDAMWSVNVKAPLRMIQLTLPHLRDTGTGRIVNVVSMSGKRVKGLFAPGYAMTKHATMALTHATRHATWDDGIRTMAVCPGYVATDMTAEFGPDASTMIQPSDLATTLATLLRLPNTAHVAELLMTCEPEVMA